MEEPKNKQEQKAMTIKITAGAGGGGIGGIVFLGGALIAATLVSAFAFKRGRTRRQQGKSSSDNDIFNQQSPPPASAEAFTDDQPNNLELMMKNSKDHHLQVIKGLSFLLPTDSSLPLEYKNPRGDATAEMGVTGSGIEPIQVLILDDEKAKLEINDKIVDPTNGVVNQRHVLSEVREEHAESTPLFDDSGNTITKEEYSFPVLEASGLEFELNEQLENSVGSDQETICFDSSVPESSAFQSYGVKPENSLPLLDSSLLSNPESMNQGKFPTETLPIFIEAVKLLEEVSEANNSGPVYGDQIEVGEKQEVYDAMVQDMIIEDAVQVAADEDQQIKFGEDQQTFKNHDEENFGSQLLAEAVEVTKEGESIDVACDHIEVGKDKPEIQLIGEELEEVKAIEVTKEENGVEITCVDQVIVEDTEEVKLIGKEPEKEDYHGENFGSQLLAEAIEVKIEGEAIGVACDHIEVGEDKPEIQIREELEEVKAIKLTKEENGVEITCVDQVIVEDTEEVKLIGKEQEKEDDLAESYVEKCEGSSTEAHPDQVSEEDKGLVQMTEDQETLVNCDEEELRSDNLIMPPLSTEAVELMKDQIKVEDEAEVKLIEEDEEECDEEVHGDIIAKKCEDESTKIAHADEVLESLENGEKDNCSDSLITEQVSSEPMVDGSLLLDSEKTPPSIETDNVDKVNEVASVDQVIIEDNLPIQLTEEATKFVEVVEKIQVEKTQQMELSDEEDDDEDENREETGEESSKGTGDSSMETNSDAVWPAESIQGVSPEFNEMKTDNQTKEGEKPDLFSSEEKDDVVNGSDNNNQTKEGEKPDLFSSKEKDDVVNGSDNNIDEDDEKVETTKRYVRELVNQSKQRSIEPWKVKALTWSMLATLWCLCHWYIGLPLVKVSLITVVISIAIFFGFPSHVPAKHK